MHVHAHTRVKNITNKHIIPVYVVRCSAGVGECLCDRVVVIWQSRRASERERVHTSSHLVGDSLLHLSSVSWSGDQGVATAHTDDVRGSLYINHQGAQHATGLNLTGLGEKGQESNCSLCDALLSEEEARDRRTDKAQRPHSRERLVSGACRVQRKILLFWILNSFWYLFSIFLSSTPLKIKITHSKTTRIVSR